MFHVEQFQLGGGMLKKGDVVCYKNEDQLFTVLSGIKLDAMVQNETGEWGHDYLVQIEKKCGNDISISYVRESKLKKIKGSEQND